MPYPMDITGAAMLMGVEGSPYLVHRYGVVREAVGVIRVDAPDIFEVEGMLAAALVAEDVARKGAHTQIHEVHEARAVHVFRLVGRLWCFITASCMHVQPELQPGMLTVIPLTICPISKNHAKCRVTKGLHEAFDHNQDLRYIREAQTDLPGLHRLSAWLQRQPLQLLGAAGCSAGRS